MVPGYSPPEPLASTSAGQHFHLLLLGSPSGMSAPVESVRWTAIPYERQCPGRRAFQEQRPHEPEESLAKAVLDGRRPIHWPQEERSERWESLRHRAEFWDGDEKAPKSDAPEVVLSAKEPRVGGSLSMSCR